MSDDVIHIYDPAGLNIEPTLDDLMGDLIGDSASTVDLINCREQLSEIKTILESGSDGELSRIVAGLNKPRECLLPSFDAIANIERLQSKNPIAAPLLQEVIMQIRLFKMGHNMKSFRMKPILVVGKPGIGKTYTIQRIADCLGLESRKIDISMGHEGMFLCGSQRGYINTTPGEVARHLSTCKTPNPVFVLDELDKGAFVESHRQPMTGPLLALLERDTAARFHDTSLRLDIDTSYISWMATANDASKIPAPILSRFIQIEFDDPTPEHMQNIIRSVSIDLLRERGLTHIFIDATSAFLAESVNLSGRDLKHVLDLAIARQYQDIDDHYTVILDVCDLKRFLKKTSTRTIGFIQ